MDIENARIPILVGITGHRDIENEQELVSHIYNVLLEICRKYQDSPIVLLTPLAEGADRAAARAVIDIKKKSIADINYLVILPMDENEYMGTFVDSESVAEYRNLKNESIGCYLVPINENLQISNISDVEERHSKLYANMGTYIALNTQILIAAWNGAEEELSNPCSINGKDLSLTKGCVSDGARCNYFKIKHGGTYHILRIRFFGVEDEYRGNDSYLTNREFGPVYWIKTKRKSSVYLAEGAPLAGPAYPDFPIGYSNSDIEGLESLKHEECVKLVKRYFQNQGEPSDAKNRTYDEILYKLNEYNKDINTMYTKLGEEIENSRKEFITYPYIENNEKKKKVFLFESGEKHLINHYAAADVLSYYYQKKRKRDVIVLVALAFLGLLSFNLYAGPLPSNWFILGYSLIYLLGSLYYAFVIKPRRYHERYVDYRGIAEGIRVQFFWHLSGINTRVADKYLTKQKSSIDWIRIAINNTLLLCKANTEACDNLIKYKDNILTTYQLWLLKQDNYYDRKSPLKDKVDGLRQRIEKILFIIGFSLAVLLAGLDTYEHNMFFPFGNNSVYEGAHRWFVFTVGFLPVIIASFKVFTEFLAYSKLARNYKWMRMVYGIALHEFKRLEISHKSDVGVFVSKSRKLFYDIGKEALLENGEWIGIFEERAPEMPK